jgi:O-antigen/teichoic acid export membrane protein
LTSQNKTLDLVNAGITDLKSKLLKNGVYNAAAGAVRIGLAMLTIPLLIRLMGVEEYGLWTFASAILGIVGLAEVGISTATTVFLSKDLANKDTDGIRQTLTIAFGTMVLLATTASFSLCIGARDIVSIFLNLEELQRLVLTRAIQFSSLVLWSKLIQQVLIGIEQAYQRYSLISLLNIIQWTLISLGMFGVAWSGGRTVELMQWNAVAGILVLLCHIYVVRALFSGIDLYLVWNRARAVIIARYCLMTWLTTLGTVLFARGDRLIVGAVLGAKILGVYATVTEIAGVINSFSALPVQPLLPNLSRITEKVSNYASEIEPRIKQAIGINSIVALSMGVGLFTLAPVVMYIILGNNFTLQEVFIFRIAIVIYTLYSLNAVGYFVLYAVNGLLENFLVHLFSSTFSLLLIAFGSIQFGLTGAIIGNAGYLGVWLLTYYSMKYLNISNLTWIKWFKLPLLYFILFIIAGFYVGNNFILMLILGIIDLTILIKWFLHYRTE